MFGECCFYLRLWIFTFRSLAAYDFSRAVFLLIDTAIFTGITLDISFALQRLSFHSLLEA
jgi:hypothetical protein